jgi:hypothetical protein
MKRKRVIWLSQRRFFLLLISLLLLPLIQPIVSEVSPIGKPLLLNIFFSMILFSSLYAISENKWLFVATLVLAVLIFCSRWMIYYLGDSPDLMAIVHVLVVIFLVLIAGTMLSHVLKDEVVTGEKVSAAICVYLFIGLIWAFLFSLTHYLRPESFRIENPVLSDFVYFSFSTLSTLGYGDITPLSPSARALSYVEAITGQIYLTVLVARLVGLHMVHSKEG